MIWAVLLFFSAGWRAAAFTTTCVSGFVLITILTFPHGDSLAMMEKSYLPALFMIMLAFCTALSRLRFQGLALGLVCAGAIHSVYTTSRRRASLTPNAWRSYASCLMALGSAPRKWPYMKPHSKELR